MGPGLTALPPHRKPCSQALVVVSESSEAQTGVGLDSRALMAVGRCVGSPRDTAATIPAQRTAISHRAVFRSEAWGSRTEGRQWV